MCHELWWANSQDKTHNPQCLRHPSFSKEGGGRRRKAMIGVCQWTSVSQAVEMGRGLQDSPPITALQSPFLRPGVTSDNGWGLRHGGWSQGRCHTPSIAFRHLPLPELVTPLKGHSLSPRSSGWRKDVVNQYLESGAVFEGTVRETHTVTRIEQHRRDAHTTRVTVKSGTFCTISLSGPEEEVVLSRISLCIGTALCMLTILYLTIRVRHQRSYSVPVLYLVTAHQLCFVCSAFGSCFGSSKCFLFLSARVAFLHLRHHPDKHSFIFIFYTRAFKDV